jgi:hypothetical protein
MKQAYILAYPKSVYNEMRTLATRTFYSVYDADDMLKIHTSNKGIALRTLEQVKNNTGPAVSI